MDGSPLEDVRAAAADPAKPTKSVPAVSPKAPAANPVQPAAAVKVEKLPQAKPPAEPKPATRATQGMKARKTQATAAVKVPAEPRPKKGEFSETKWFMAGELVKEDEIGPEAYPVQQLEPRYRKTRELPPEVRRKYSLTRDDGTAPKKG
jgi:hypothetical protein